MRVLILSKYGPLAASTRHRFLQFLPWLASEGIECEVSTLLDDTYLRELFEHGRASRVHAIRALVRRIGAMGRAGRFDVVLLYLESYPYLPVALTRALRWRGIPYVYDMDDAIFHRYDQHRSHFVRAALGGKIPEVIRGASEVFAGNRYLADYAGRFNDRVSLVPTVIDPGRYPIVEKRRTNSTFTIGWIGSPSTAPYLHLIEGALREFCSGGRARVVLIGAGPIDLPGVPVEHRAWSETTEVGDLRELDVGVMPLPGSRWAQGKCGFKLIQYMACGIPVVASPTGANLDIVEDEASGLLPTDERGWVRAFERLSDDPAERDRMGRRGREIVEASYSTTAVRETIRDGLLRAAKRGSKRTRSTEASVVEGFGREWSRFDQSRIADGELSEMYQNYFYLFPWSTLGSDAVGFDLGCGSGRWARLVAPRVGTLHCIDPSEEAIAVARKNLSGFDNCRFHQASAHDMPLEPDSADFGYTLGVLHHIEDTEGALRACVSVLKEGAPLLLYLYYAFDNRPFWYKWIWRMTVPLRIVLSRMPFGLRYLVSQLIAAVVYYPVARFARLAEKLGADVANFPLSAYRHRSFYVLRTDALDRFGTRLEKRFTRQEIASMMKAAGLERIEFSDRAFWCAIGYRKQECAESRD